MKVLIDLDLNNLGVLQGEGGGGHGRGLVTQLLVLGLRHLRRCGERRGLAEAVAGELDEEVRVVQSHAAVRLTEEHRISFLNKCRQKHFKGNTVPETCGGRVAAGLRHCKAESETARPPELVRAGPRRPGSPRSCACGH